MADLGKMLVLLGMLVAVAGAILLAAGRIPWLGRLPGDFVVRRDGLTFYFPLATCILLSVVASLLLAVFRR